MVNRGTDIHFRFIRNLALIIRKRMRHMGVKGKGKGESLLPPNHHGALWVVTAVYRLVKKPFKG